MHDGIGVGVIGVDTLIRKATPRREELVHLLVIDVDGEEGENSLRELEARFGHLPHTMVVSTPRGMHLWFWTREKSRLRKRTLAPGLELHGAFTNSPIVDKPLPPSRRLMPDGTWFEYTFLLDHSIVE